MFSISLTGSLVHHFFTRTSGHSPFASGSKTRRLWSGATLMENISLAGVPGTRNELPNFPSDDGAGSLISCIGSSWVWADAHTGAQQDSAAINSKHGTLRGMLIDEGSFMRSTYPGKLSSTSGKERHDHLS